jgi:hypothetical protein
LELIGVALVMAAGLTAAEWIARSVPVDIAYLRSVPAQFGFTTWSGHPVRSHPGADAPLFVAPAPPPPLCAPQHATFAYGIADLKVRLGEIMGDPVECEHAIDAEGDSRQMTTTGLATYQRRTQTVTFTDGWHHWALAQDTLIAWEGVAQPGFGTGL